MRKKDEKYALGLDIGTNSVGWAAINDSYELVKVNNKDAWGVVLFEGAKTAKDRRLSRSGRRRLERRRMRIRLLQELMAEGIEPVDPNFYIRLKESSYHVGEGKYFRSNHFNLFDGGEYTDAQYFHEYPTIYHLRKRLVENKEKADIRLVYLAIHHIIKYRGHFLNEGGMDSAGGSPEAAAGELFGLLNENYRKDLFYIGKEEAFTQALLDGKSSRSMRQENAYNVLTSEKKDKFVTALTKAVTGLKANLTDLLCIEDEEDAIKDENDKPVSICFADAKYGEEKEDKYYSLERADILLAAEKLYAAIELNAVLRGKKLLCEAMVDKFRKHAEDLAAIRKLIRGMGDKALYNDFFRKGKGANYTGYIGDKRYGIYVAKEKKKKEDGQSSKYCDYERPGKEDLYKRIREILNKAPDSKEKEYIEKEIIKEDFLPLITSKDNAYIPYQLNLKELDAILENQGKFYPCLAENADKIRALLTFRRPYYVGTLKGDFSWAKEIDLPDEKITPWNFYKQLDGKLDDIAEKFISRMTNDCTLIKGESALPLNSMLYQKYVLLNEINKIKVFDKPISVEWKQAIYELCKKRKTVKKSDIAARLNKKFNIQVAADNIGGLSDEKKLTASLSTYVDFVKMFGEEFVKANIVVKSIRLEENGTMRESMSFPPFKFIELADQKWEDSDVYEYFSETKFLFVVYRRQGEEYVLKGARLWNMPAADLDGTVREGWEEVQRIIKEGVRFTVNPDGRISNDLPGKKDNRIIHIRPHATRSAYRLNNGIIRGNVERDANPLPDGQWMTTQSFWINNSYILEQLSF